MYLAVCSPLPLLYRDLKLVLVPETVASCALRSSLALSLMCNTMSSIVTAAPHNAEPASKVGANLAPFNPSSEEVITTALHMLQLKETDTVYDLGCGDARFLVQAALRAGAHGVGIEYDKVFADRAKTRVLQAGLSNLVTIYHDNALNIDLTAATAAFVYLVPKGMAQLRPKLEALLLRGCRVVTYSKCIRLLQVL
jgi:precorrin-6B methylase 2